MIRRRLVQLEPQETPHAQRIGRPPRDPALRVEPFEVPEQQQAEIATRGQAWTPQLVGVESLTARLDVPIEVRFVEDLVQAPIERMRGSGVRGIDRVDPFKDFHHGLLGPDRTKPSPASRLRAGFDHTG